MMKVKNLILILPIVLLFGCTSDFDKKVKQSVETQLRIYPKSTLQDFYKNFFQDRFGPEHAIADTISARLYLENELASFETSENPDIEPLGLDNHFVRVNLMLVKKGKIPADALLMAFIESAKKIDADEIPKWRTDWKKITNVIEMMNLQIPDFEKDKMAIDRVLAQGKYALHHSAIFRETYHPHYRIVEQTIFEKRLKPFLANTTL